MNEGHRHSPILARLGAVGVIIVVSACGKGAVRSGSLVGEVGRPLATHAGEAPQAAAVCAMQKSLDGAPPGMAEKPFGALCEKEATSDRLWQTAVSVVGAYTAKLERVGTGADPASAGQVDAALTGIENNDWITVEDPLEKEARIAVAELVHQLKKPVEKKELDEAVKAAGPHVKTICDGLDLALQKQLEDLAGIQKELDKRRATRADRRCGTVNQQNFCVQDNAVDRLVHANAYADIAVLERDHRETKNALAAFCAAHEKLAAAAGKKQLSDKETASAVLAAVKAAPRVEPGAAPATDAAPAADTKPDPKSQPAAK